MRVYRAEEIESQIELLRTDQKDLGTNIARKKASIKGMKVQADALHEVMELTDQLGLAMGLKSTVTSLQKQIILNEARIQGMYAEITALDNEIEKLESLFLSVKAENGLENALRKETAEKEQGDDI